VAAQEEVQGDGHAEVLEDEPGTPELLEAFQVFQSAMQYYTAGRNNGYPDVVLAPAKALALAEK
jgi:hypothetical protein